MPDWQIKRKVVADLSLHYIINIENCNYFVMTSKETLHEQETLRFTTSNLNHEETAN